MKINTRINNLPRHPILLHPKKQKPFTSHLTSFILDGYGALTNEQEKYGEF